MYFLIENFLNNLLNVLRVIVYNICRKLVRQICSEFKQRKYFLNIFE